MTDALSDSASNGWRETPCPVCAEVSWGPADPVFRAGDSEPFPVQACTVCGLRRLGALLDPAAASRYYSAGYYAQEKASSDFRTHVKQVLEGAGEWLPDALRTFISISLVPRAPHAGARLLDVGCGSGNLMVRARTLGWDVVGTELSDATAAVARARGLSVLTGCWEGQLQPRSFDLIVLNHVIEHVANPRNLLKTLAEALAVRGQIHIGLPDFGCVQSRLFGGAWWANLPPEHVWFFERRHVAALVTAAGLKPLEWRDLNRVAAQLRPAIWRHQWAVWRTSGGNALGFASRLGACLAAAALPGIDVAIPQARNVSTMYTVVCARA